MSQFRKITIYKSSKYCSVLGLLTIVNKFYVSNLFIARLIHFISKGSKSTKKKDCYSCLDFCILQEHTLEENERWKSQFSFSPGEELLMLG